MAIVSIPSAASVRLSAPVTEISGIVQIDTITGVFDGQYRTIIPTGAWSFGSSSNVSASTAAQVSGTPVVLLCRNGTLYQVGAVGYASTGTGSLVRATSPTIVTPVIASFATAQHDHDDAAGGGQIGSAAIAAAEKTGSGDIVCQVAPSITEPVITNFIQLGTVYIIVGSGSPEGVIAATVGSTFHRDDGGVGTTIYAKSGGGSGNTGWTALT